MNKILKKVIAAATVFAATASSAFVIKSINASAYSIQDDVALSYYVMHDVCGFSESVSIEKIVESGFGIYPDTFLVTAVNLDTDEVYLWSFGRRDGCGNELVITGVEDWMEGDIASVIMFDNGSQEVFDDTIVDIRYAGWLY